jgi:hypothetical protein
MGNGSTKPSSRNLKKAIQAQANASEHWGEIVFGAAGKIHRFRGRTTTSSSRATGGVAESYRKREKRGQLHQPRPTGSARCMYKLGKVPRHARSWQRVSGLAAHSPSTQKELGQSGGLGVWPLLFRLHAGRQRTDPVEAGDIVEGTLRGAPEKPVQPDKPRHHQPELQDKLRSDLWT